jgi:hypothetical protein
VSETELVGERLPALSTACTLNVFEVWVPYVIQRSMPAEMSRLPGQPRAPSASVGSGLAGSLVRELRPAHARGVGSGVGLGAWGITGDSYGAAV